MTTAVIVIAGIVIVAAAVAAYLIMLLAAITSDLCEQQRDEQHAPVCAGEPARVGTIRDAAPRLSVDAKSNSSAAA
jgi:hypothetical protein